MSEGGKRNRSSNFTKEEELLLIQEIGKFKNIIECKTTNKITKKEKEEAWNNILASFNAKNKVQARKLEQIQSKYDNLKSKAKKEVADLNKSIKGTGGGPSCYYTTNPATEAVLNLISYKTVVGLECSFDGDSKATPSQVQSLDVEPSCSYSPGAAVPSFEPTSPIIFEYVDCEDYAVVLPDVSTSTSRSDQEIIAENKSLSEDTVDWSVYTPLKLKQKTSKKLRRTVSNPVFTAKEQFYKFKLQYLKNAEEREIQQAIKNQKRLEEEHTKKMICLDLDIKLKQQELNKN